MKKVLLLTLLCTLFSSLLQAQVTMKGIVLKKFKYFKPGDTVTVYGPRILPTASKAQLLVKKKQTPIFIQKDRIKILDKPMHYWEKIWFDNKGAEITHSGWEENKRKILAAKAVTYYVNAQEDGLIYEDDVLYDYIYQLLLKIHPTKLSKPNDENMSLIIIKSNEIFSYTFINGSIVLSTGLISKTTNEKELIKVLSHCVAEIVLEPNLVNLASKPKLKRTIKRVSRAFSQDFQHKHLPDEMYIRKISGVISYAAWQEFNVMNYGQSIKLINRIKAVNLVMARDYLLLAKLYRITKNTPESNRKALGFIAKGKNQGFTPLIDFDKEAGLLYLRLENETAAKTAFLNYKNGLLEMSKQGSDVAYDLEAINQILYKNGMLD